RMSREGGRTTVAVVFYILAMLLTDGIGMNQDSDVQAWTGGVG
ncbi:MAG: hypothetical protein ACJAV2_004796, partial [Myxococcota bacterium]